MKKVVTDLQVNNKTVLVRVDFNVPHKGAEITDDNRIHAAIPTIAELLKNNAKVVLMSHYFICIIFCWAITNLPPLCLIIKKEYLLKFHW